MVRSSPPQVTVLRRTQAEVLYNPLWDSKLGEGEGFLGCGHMGATGVILRMEWFWQQIDNFR